MKKRNTQGRKKLGDIERDGGERWGEPFRVGDRSPREEAWVRIL